jgi:hypothetical protein
MTTGAGGEGAGYRSAELRGDVGHQRAEGVGVGVAVPIAQVGPLNATESERRARAVEEHGDEDVATASVVGFLAHPVGGDRRRRPHDEHAARPRQRFGDDVIEGTAGRDLAIPPHRPAVRRQRVGKRLHPRPVGARVADEDVGHASACLEGYLLPPVFFSFSRQMNSISCVLGRSVTATVVPHGFV